MRRQVHRFLLWLWKVAPFPLWARRLFLGLIAHRFLIGALAIIEDEAGRVLLVKHTYRVQRPWGLPGGWIKSAETVEQGLAREVLEETGLEVEVGRVLGICPGPYGELVIVFACRATGGRLAPAQVEVSEVGYFQHDRPPPMEAVYQSVLALWQAQSASPRP
ncbi:MAG: NUDIX domain-containing protein [Chloroflexi bacterium]|nr:NUDIX domain-containing protein [Chloroflexota bacterium]